MRLCKRGLEPVPNREKAITTRQTVVLRRNRSEIRTSLLGELRVFSAGVHARNGEARCVVKTPQQRTGNRTMKKQSHKKHMRQWKPERTDATTMVIGQYEQSSVRLAEVVILSGRQ